MDHLEASSAAFLDRGIIIEKTDGPRYRVESYGRAGVKTRPIESVNKYVHEYRSDPPYDAAAYEDKFEYYVGDEVYFFLFPDGRGMILGKMIRE